MTFNEKKNQEDETEDIPVSSFQSYAAEGDLLAKQGDYKKAIEAYSKGIFQKAEALYSRGDFEMALVFYHRGHRIRPELDDFRLGIQKASEAIDNSIGNPKNYKFQPPTGVKLVISNPTPTKGANSNSGERKKSTMISWVIPKPVSTAGHNPVVVKEVASPKTAKQLLGELNADKEYLQDLFKDRDFVNNPNNFVKSLVDDALEYLDTRTEFWRQQKPLYARKNEHARELSAIISNRNNRLIAEKAEKHHQRKASELEKMKSTGVFGFQKADKSRPYTAPAKISK